MKKQTGKVRSFGNEWTELAFTGIQNSKDKERPTIVALDNNGLIYKMISLESVSVEVQKWGTSPFSLFAYLLIFGKFSAGDFLSRH